MDMMPLRIKIFFHACLLLVYSIFSTQNSDITTLQEQNDQPFPYAL
jgi:hypothetical protein